VIATEDRAFASLLKADSMNGRADEIERQADKAIYSDDPDACERLEAKIANLEAQRTRIKIMNKAIRKHGLARLLAADPPLELTQAERRELVQVAELCPQHHVGTKGFPSYVLSNLSGNLTRQRQRLAQLTKQS